MKRHYPAVTILLKVPHEVVACQWEVHQVDQVVKDHDSEKVFNFLHEQNGGGQEVGGSIGILFYS